MAAQCPEALKRARPSVVGERLTARPRPLIIVRGLEERGHAGDLIGVARRAAEDTGFDVTCFRTRLELCGSDLRRTQLK